MGVKHTPLTDSIERPITIIKRKEPTKKLLALWFFIVALILFSIYIFINYEKDLKNYINREIVNTEDSQINEFVNKHDWKNFIEQGVVNTEDSQINEFVNEYYSRLRPQHSRQKRQLLQMTMSNAPDCKRISEECKVVLEGIEDISKMVQLRMQSLQQSLVKQGILRKDQPQDEKLRKIFECLKCRNTIRPNDFPSPHVLKPVYRNADNSMGTKGDDLADEKNERYPKAVVHETVTNNTKMINGQRITVILHNKTIIENNNGQGEENNETPKMVKTTMSVTPAPITENTRQYSRVEVDPQQTVPVCFYMTAQTTEATPNMDPYKYYQSMYSPSGQMTPVRYFDPNDYSSQYQTFAPGEQNDNQEMRVYCFSVPLSRNAHPFSMIPRDRELTPEEAGYKNQSSWCDGYLCEGKRGSCIDWKQVCDSRQDCPLGDDEKNCDYDRTTIRTVENGCTNGEIPCKASDICINPHTARCNGRVECPFGDDEQNCDSKVKSMGDNEVDSNTQQPTYFDKYTASETKPQTSPVTQSTTSAVTSSAILPEMPEHFVCKKIIQTIPIEKRCNNVYDCEDATDEEDCTCKDYLRWEHASAICDGHVDCSDGSDEDDCNICQQDQYHCHRSGTCISKKKRCDDKNDCKFNEDELDCFALTDGNHINFDMDKRPHLNLEGVITRYINGGWKPICFDSEKRSEPARMNAAQIVCEYLGFKDVESAQYTLVQSSQLTEKSKSKDHSLSYEYSIRSNVPQYSSGTCYGLSLRCKPILDRKLNVHAKISPLTKERSYMWPWEASIFVNGIYHCSALLLESDLLLSSSECGEGIDPSKNYTTALLGVASPDLPFSGPYHQMSPIVEIKSIKNSDASLFHLKDKTKMTRYVQPLYLEKRIFPASKNDTCVAIGVNKRHERKMMFLEPVVDNCPKCHRCYIEDDQHEESSCSMKNNTLNWNGYVVCLSEGGWYPAAVFHDKDESCGFGTKQILNSIDYLHAHLYEAVDKKSNDVEEPPCDGIRCALGKCIPWDSVCDGLRDCPDGVDESPKYCQKMKERCQDNIFECKCTKSELRCGNGKCVPKEKFCDGRQDCGDGSDEPETCTCGEYLKLVEPKRVCDGRQHCLDKSDEKYQDCMCKDSSFKCHKSQYKGAPVCVPQDFVCDGVVDCPEAEDEAESVCWAIKTSADRDPKGKGEVMRRTNGILHSECFPRPIKSQREVTNVCSKLGYISGFLLDSTKTSDSQYVPRNDFFMFQLNNYTWMSMRPDTSYGVWAKPDHACYRLFVHCFV